MSSLRAVGCVVYQVVSVGSVPVNAPVVPCPDFSGSQLRRVPIAPHTNCAAYQLRRISIAPHPNRAAAKLCRVPIAPPRSFFDFQRLSGPPAPRFPSVLTTSRPNHAASQNTLRSDWASSCRLRLTLILIGPHSTESLQSSFFFFFLRSGILGAGIRGSDDTKYVQHVAVGDFGTRRALQRQHVPIPRRGSRVRYVRKMREIYAGGGECVLIIVFKRGEG